MRRESNPVSGRYLRAHSYERYLARLLRKLPSRTVILKPRRVQSGSGPVVIGLAAGAIVLLAGLLINGCQISKLLTAATEENVPLAVNPTRVRDSALVGSSAPRVANLNVSNSGDWAATTGNDWIRMNPSSGGARGTVRLSLDPKDLTPGLHEGEVMVKQKSSDGDSVTVDVSFLILQPILSISATSLKYTAYDDHTVFHDTVKVTNKGNGPLVWTARIARSSDWISLGATAGDGPGDIPVRISSEGLMYFATYRDTIVVNAEGAKNSPARIAVQIRRRKDD